MGGIIFYQQNAQPQYREGDRARLVPFQSVGNMPFRKRSCVFRRKILPYESTTSRLPPLSVAFLMVLLCVFVVSAGTYVIHPGNFERGIIHSQHIHLFDLKVVP